MTAPPLDTVFRRRENEGEPVNDRRLRAAIDHGRIVRVAYGVYADRQAWHDLTPLQRHAQRVWEAAARLSPGIVFSHSSAAALLGIDRVTSWPNAIEVSIGRSSGGRSSGLIRRHSRDVDALEIAAWGPHFVTTPLQTTLDLISSERFADGVVAADQALWRRRRGGPLVVQEPLVDAAHSLTGRGSARAARAVEFASDLSDSVGETESRVTIWTLGFPAPELQAPFVLSDGTEARTDFFWRRYRHAGEFDGLGKYQDPGLLRGRTPAQVVIAEKDREDEIRRQVHAFSRWRTPALRNPRLLYDILTSAGLPSSRPRPGR